MKVVKHVPRFLAAALFAASTASAVVLTGATQAGRPASGVFTSVPEAANAAVSIGIGVGGGPRYNRYAYRSGSWIRIGFGYGSPGYASGYFLGYGPPPIGYYPPAPYYGRPYYGGYGPRYVRPYYGRPYGGYDGGYYGRGSYGRGYDGRGYGGRGDYGHGGYNR